MSKIKVMHCLGQLNTGGAETLMMNIFRHIERDKFQFDFLLFNDEKGFYDDEAKSLGANLHYTPSMGHTNIFKYVRSIIKILKDQDIDIVHSHMDWQGGFIVYAAYKAGIKKRIVHSHANQEMFKTSLLHKLLISINKYLIKRYATDCIACSQEAGESLFRQSFEVLINGIDIERFLNPNQEIIVQLKQELNIQDTDIILGNVGSLSENKNQRFLIEILSKLDKNYKLVLVGDGAMKDKLKQLSKGLNVNDRVIFAGVRKEVPEIMQLFNIFLFPSKKEGLGIVAIEAQVSGVSCIVSESIPKQIDVGEGLIKRKPLIFNEWVDSITNINKNKTNINKQKIIDSHFSIKKSCEKLIRIYIR
ncbi:glycosyltransferase [Thomasclavelia cocleata]|uniref:glycosyltransferase n=1 Tax=Thomasclavelia cocleata TaxID=69824 RepID=UPI00242AA738|nr:glycosyltransferase [Thomasclavelia cocleata]